MKKYIFTTLLMILLLPLGVIAQSNKINDQTLTCQNFNVHKSTKAEKAHPLGGISATQKRKYSLPLEKGAAQSAISDITNDFVQPLHTTFKLKSSTKSMLDENIVFERYQQYYKGIEVVGGGYTVATNARVKAKSSKSFVPYIAATPNFNVDNLISKNEIERILDVRGVKHDLKIINNIENNCSFQLVYLCHYNDGSPKVGYIDAYNGKLLKTASSIENKNAPTEDYGTQDMLDIVEFGMSVLKSDDGNRIVATHDFTTNGWPGGFQTDQFIPTMFSGKPEWTDEADPSIFQSHWITSKTADFFEVDLGINFTKINVGAYATSFGIDVYDGANTFSSSTIDDAVIHLGTFNQSTYAEYDVVGHELCHTYLHDYFSGSTLANKSIAEGICDMFGVYTEYKLSTPIDLDWKLGNNIDPSYDYRDLQNPLYSCYDDVLNEPEEHNRSTPLGYWFYLITEGLSSPSCNNFSGLGIENAMAVVQGTVPFLSGEMDFPDVRVASIQAAEALFGPASSEVDIINKAWNEICVPDIIAQNEVIDQNGVYGSITVKSGNTLTITNAVIELLPNATITVEENATLIIDNATLTACAEKWASIRCDYGTIIVQNNSIVEKGNIAIFSFFGCQLAINTNSVFREHFAGCIVIKNDNFPITQNHDVIIDDATFLGSFENTGEKSTIGLVTGISNTSVTNSTFSGFDAGILCNGELPASNILINKSTFELNRVDIASQDAQSQTVISDNTTTDSDLFSIYIERSINIDVASNTFNDHELGMFLLDSECRVFNQNQFLSCTTGIESMSTSPGISELLVQQDNYFFDAQRAIIISGVDNFNGATIIDNIFEDNQVGIYANGINHFAIEENTFISGSSANIIKATGGHVNFLYCNEIIEPRVGIQFHFLNNLTTFEGNLLSNATANDVHYNSDILNNIGTLNEPALNIFSTITENIHVYDPLELGYWSMGIDPFNYWLPQNPIGNTDPSGIPSSWESISSSNVNENCNIPEPPSVTLIELFNLLQEYCDLLNQLELDPDNESLQQQVEDAELRAKRAIYYAFQGQFSWADLEVVLTNACDFFGNAQLFSVYIKQGKCAEAEDLLDDMEAILSTSHNNSKRELIERMRIESFVKIMRIGLKYICADPQPEEEIIIPAKTDVFTSSEIQELLVEAQTDLPEAAYARTLYFIATGTLLPLHDPAELLVPRSPQDNKLMDVIDLIVYPNPANTNLTIQVKDITLYSKVVLSDIMGKAINIVPLSKDQNNIYLDLTSYANGLYFISLYDQANKLAKQQKVIINHD